MFNATIISDRNPMAFRTSQQALVLEGRSAPEWYVKMWLVDVLGMHLYDAWGEELKTCIIDLNHLDGQGIGITRCCGLRTHVKCMFKWIIELRLNKVNQSCSNCRGIWFEIIDHDK